MNRVPLSLDAVFAHSAAWVRRGCRGALPLHPFTPARRERGPDPAALVRNPPAFGPCCLAFARLPAPETEAGLARCKVEGRQW